MNNIGKAFSYVFDDPQWLTKVLVGGLVLLSSIFIIPIPLLVGYLVELRSRVINRSSPLLPEWSDLGSKYSKGLVLLLGLILYSLVGIILKKTGVPLFSKMFARIYNLVMTFYLPVMSVFYAQEPKFESMFKIQEIFQFMVKNFIDLLVFWLLHFVLGIIALVGLIGFVVGIIFTAFYSFLVEGYLYASLYRDRA